MTADAGMMVGSVALEGVHDVGVAGYELDFGGTLSRESSGEHRTQP